MMSRNTGEFRTILHQVKEISEKLKEQESLTEEIEVVGGNLTILGDEVFKKLKDMENRITKNIGDIMKFIYKTNK